MPPHQHKKKVQDDDDINCAIHTTEMLQKRKEDGLSCAVPSTRHTQNAQCAFFKT